MPVSGMQVLRADGSKVKGLYAAGEVPRYDLDLTLVVVGSCRRDHGRNLGCSRGFALPYP